MRLGRFLVRGPTVPLILLLLAGTACESRPQAPALRDSSVYQNRSAGMRFLVPQGWTQVANSTLPEGPLPAEMMLVKYQMKTTARGAMLELLCQDNSEKLDLGDYHAQASHGVPVWQREAEPESLTVGGAAAQRFMYQARTGTSTMHKDVTVFRRGARVFSFVGLYWDDDHNAQEEIRRAIGSIVW
ncbi:MAG: hypothetical protein U0935_02530 [Pirellulales bacterium]